MEIHSSKMAQLLVVVALVIAPAMPEPCQALLMVELQAESLMRRPIHNAL